MKSISHTKFQVLVNQFDAITMIVYREIENLYIKSLRDQGLSKEFSKNMEHGK